MDYLIRNYIDGTKVRAIPCYYSELNHRRRSFLNFSCSACAWPRKSHGATELRQNQGEPPRDWPGQTIWAYLTVEIAAIVSHFGRNACHGLRSLSICAMPFGMHIGRNSGMASMAARRPGYAARSTSMRLHPDTPCRAFPHKPPPFARRPAAKAPRVKSTSAARTT